MNRKKIVTTIIMKNLLVVCDIPDANLFLTSVNSDTLPLLYSKDALLQVMADNTFERIGIAFEKKELFDVDFRLFNVKHIDFLACDTLNDPMWLEYYKTLQDAGITVGASDNKTGNLKYGGDWVMESTSEDIEKVYFSTGIEYYKYLLGPHSDFMFVMKSSGLYGSGNNTYGQLGGNTRDTTVFTGCTAVSCGVYHTVAIKDGILYGCGSDPWNYGQLGSAGPTGTLTRMGLTGCTVVSCAYSHTVAIKDGILYGCGYGSDGQLGSAVLINNRTGTLTPMGLTGCTAVSCGQVHTVAIKDGILYGCGWNVYGQLGSAGRSTLKPISGLTGFTAVSCGLYHTVAIKDGILYGCGKNTNGQLGSAVNIGGNTGTLTQMGITGVTAVSCGYKHTVAIKDGILYGCGYNLYGQLGSAVTPGGSTGTLTQMSGETGFMAVSCGMNHTVAIKDGILYGAGSNANRLLADTSISNYNSFELIDTNVLNINDISRAPAPAPAPAPAVAAYAGSDPYITTFQGFKYKLPNILRTYRLLEYLEVYVNASVSQLTTQEQDSIVSYNGGCDKVLLDGFYFDTFFIGNSHSYAIFNRQLEMIDSANLTNYRVEIQTEPKIFSCPIQGKTYYVAKKIYIEDVTIELQLYSNPQMLNGIIISVCHPEKAGGLLSSSSNPKNFCIKSIDNVKPVKVKDSREYKREVKENWISRKIM